MKLSELKRICDEAIEVYINAASGKYENLNDPIKKAEIAKIVDTFNDECNPSRVKKMIELLEKASAIINATPYQRQSIGLDMKDWLSDYEKEFGGKDIEALESFATGIFAKNEK